VVLLGSTGSIGVNTLEVAKKFNIDVEILVCGKNIELLNKQILEHSPKVVVIADADDIHKVNHSNVLSGSDAILQVIQDSDSELVVNALVGFLGLRPTLTALEAGKKIALANKESLVAFQKVAQAELDVMANERKWIRIDGSLPAEKITERIIREING